LQFGSGLSPHALYSTLPELVRLSAAAAREQGWLLTTHVAESDEEWAMYRQRSGALYDWLKTQRDMSDCGPRSPVAQLHSLGALGENMLLVHGNYMDDEDIALVAQARTSVVHCPRSHDYFAHQRFQAEKLLKAEVNLCLGTDSLASVRLHRNEPAELDLFKEMQLFQREHPTIPPTEIIKMVTTNPALFLQSKKLGGIFPGAFADLVCLPAKGASAIDEQILHHSGKVSGVMIGGDWKIVPAQAE
jgi:cytosine/adenosine deaminase-related metal-dependent hydrolase